MAETTHTTPLPLEGIKVLECCSFLAGPFCASLLADYGAEVIKVEPPKTGDTWRKNGVLYKGVGIDFISDNRNKKGITLNFKHPKGQEIARKLAARSDVMLENFREGVLEEWGLGYEDLRKINPGLIMVRISGFGQTGPYRHRPAFGRIAEAMSGIVYMLGEPSSPPAIAGVALGDLTTGQQCAFSIMIALWHRQKTGEGQWLDAALCESLFRLLEGLPAVYQLTGKVREREGAWNPLNPTNGHYQAGDGNWLAIRSHSDATAQRLFKLMSRPEMAADPRFATHEARIRNGEDVKVAVTEWVSKHTRKEVLSTLEANEIACGPINSIADVMADPHFRERQAFVEVEHPVLGKVLQSRPAPRLSKTPGRIATLGPELGQHNEDVYCGILGLSKDEVAGLREEGVI